MTLALFVDGHVHIHRCFDIGRFFLAAQRNLHAAALACGYRDGQWRGALLLVESGAERVFERLAAGSLVPPAGIRVEHTEDAAALHVRIGDRDSLYLFAGRQIATTSGVEVLSLVTREVVPDGLKFDEAMDRSCATHGFTTIPWGFGKWSMARGELVRKELSKRAPGSIALGDNGGRLRFAPAPPLFKFAKELGFVILPGSDPFPFSAQVDRVGSFGFVVPDWVEDEKPAQTLVNRFRNLTSTPRYFGRLTAPGHFVVSQLRMQLHNRLHLARTPV